MSASSQKSVAIIGSGLSGLTAANLLRKFGFSVTVFEAGERIGGRTFSVWEGRTQLAMGAMWLHGGTGNPLYQLVKRLGLLEAPPGQDNLPDLCCQQETYQYDWAQCAVVTDSGRPVPNRLVRTAEQTVRRVMAEAYEIPEARASGCYGDRMGAYLEAQFQGAAARTPAAGLEPATFQAALRTFALFFANVEGVHSLHDLSIRGGAEYSCPRGQCLVRGGLGALVEALAAGLPDGCMRLRSRVERVAVSPEGSAALLVGSDWQKFDHALVTVSLGVLQTSKLLEPGLPSPDWLAAVEQMQLGVVDKIFVRLALPLKLPDDCRHLWIVREKLCRSWLDGLISVSAVNEPGDIFILWVAGNYAREMESRTVEHLEADLVPFLEAVLRCQLPKVTKIWRSTFGSDPNFLGSYSSYKPGCSPGAALKLSQPIETTLASGDKKPVVCFAGEHTSERHYATVQGAFQSGIREARRLGTHYRVAAAKAKDLIAML